MNKFFKSNEERSLWIELNAERIVHGDIMLGRSPRKMGSLDEAFTALYISKNQLEFDEARCDMPRLSLEELFLPEDELYYLNLNRGMKKIENMFTNINHELF